MRARIERHRVGAAALSSAQRDFADRLAGEVYRMRHDACPSYGWQMISDELLDYVGARSVADPGLGGKDIRVAVESATAMRKPVSPVASAGTEANVATGASFPTSSVASPSTPPSGTIRNRARRAAFDWRSKA